MLVTNSNDRRRSSFVSSVNSVDNHSITSSIGGRLSSSIRSVQVAKLRDELEATEASRLVGDEQQFAPSEAPALLIWIFPALTCAVAYAFYNIFIKKGSYSIHPILGGVVLQFVAALFGTVLMLVIMATGKGGHESMIQQYNQAGLMWSIYAGLAVGTAEMLSFLVNGMGVDATQSIPVIIGGSVLFGALMGMIFLSEHLMWHGWSGIAMLVTGIALVATDPGDKAVEGGGGDSEMIAPPLAIWIGPALVCACAYAFYNIFIKLGSAHINPILGGVILQFVAALFGSILLGALCVKEGGVSFLNYDAEGLVWACCAGIAVGSAEMLSFVVSGLGVPATQSIPVIIGGSTFFGALLGLLMLGEELMFQGWSGVVLLMIGIAVVATDPGEKGLIRS